MSRASMPAGGGCFHCGTPCGAATLVSHGKAFCCRGCLTVFELLTENGLADFYQLGEQAGVRVRNTAAHEQFRYLDEPSVREQLVDFADDRITRVTFRVPSVHCVACVWLLENLFRLKPGVGQSRVNFPRKEVAITFENGQVTLSAVVALLASLGYEPDLKLSDLDGRPKDPAARRLWMQLGIAGFAFGNIMLFSISSYFGLDRLDGPTFRTLFGLLSLALSIPVVLYSATDYWRSAWFNVRQGRLTIDVPIAAGIVALFAQSSWEVLSGRGEGYFDSLTGLLFFLLCGRLFQRKTYDRLTFDRDYKFFFPLSVARKKHVRKETCPEPDLAAKEKFERPVPSHTAPAREPAPFPPFGHPLPLRAGERWGEGEDGTSDSIRPGFDRAEQEVGAPVEERVALGQLAIGDRLVLRNGELIPADARLIEGPALIDYSFVTGESEPLEKKAGDQLYAGGRQIGGAIEAEVLKPVSQSYLASLWSQAAFRKDKSESLNTLTNLYSQRFTKIVIAIAIGAAFFWAVRDPDRSLKAFTSVLIVACPCALALAAPFALGTAQRVLARRNVFLKDASVLETLARVDAVVFDKTGTLTAAGAGSITFRGAPLTEEEESWLYSMTRQSTHPYAVRIGESIACQAFAGSVRSFVETTGCGIEGNVAGHEIWMGSAAWLKSRGTIEHQNQNELSWSAGSPSPRPSPPGEGEGGHRSAEIRLFSPRSPLSHPTGERGDAGQSLSAARASSPIHGSAVHVAIDGNYRGCYLLTSALRPRTHQLIDKLSANYELALLSGDHGKERERFEGLFGQSAHLQFNQSPLDKLGFIQRLQQSGRTVMMVGDGLNDAGALKQSDVGMAVVENIGTFSPASDVILTAGMVPRLDQVLRFSRSAVRIVRLSFLISSIYNVVGISIAARGLLSPVICAILMPLSSVTVVAFACGATSWLGRRVFGDGLSAATAEADGRTEPGESVTEKQGERRFKERPLSILRPHRDDEPEHAELRAGVPPALAADGDGSLESARALALAGQAGRLPYFLRFMANVWLKSEAVSDPVSRIEGEP